MSIYQFIVDIQWPLLLLIFMAVGFLWVKFMKAETRDALQSVLIRRGIKASVGSVSLELSTPADPGTVAVAAAPDGQLAKELESAGAESTGEDVQRIRRGAVEQLVREAAEWGWNMARAGTPYPPVPEFDWEGEVPSIDYGFRNFSPVEKALLRLSSNRDMPGI